MRKTGIPAVYTTWDLGHSEHTSGIIRKLISIRAKSRRTILHALEKFYAVTDKRTISETHTFDISRKIANTDEMRQFVGATAHKEYWPAIEDKLDYLLEADTIVKETITSSPMRDETRVDSVIRQYEESSQIEPDRYTRFAFCIEYSTKHPIIMNEEEQLREFFTSICPDESRALIFITTDRKLKDNIQVNILATN